MAGRADVLDPIGTGAVNHSGTLNSSVMSMAAVAAAIEVLRDDPPYERTERYAEQLRAELTRLGDEHGIALRVQGLPAALHASIGDGAVVDAASLAANRDAKAYASLASELTARGVGVAGRGVWDTSAANGERELDAVVERAGTPNAALRRGGASGLTVVPPWRPAERDAAHLRSPARRGGRRWRRPGVARHAAATCW